MRTLRHLLRLFKQLTGLASRQGAWWLLPLVFTLILVGLLVFAAQAGSPFVYTFF